MGVGVSWQKDSPLGWYSTVIQAARNLVKHLLSQLLLSPAARAGQANSRLIATAAIKRMGLLYCKSGLRSNLLSADFIPN